MTDEKDELIDRRIKALKHRPRGWDAVFHESEDRSTTMTYPVVFWAVVTERRTSGQREAVYAMVYDARNLDDALSFAHECTDFIGLAEPGEAKERYWDDIAKQRVECERDAERRAERRRREEEGHCAERVHKPGEKGCLSEETDKCTCRCTMCVIARGELGVKP